MNTICLVRTPITLYERVVFLLYTVLPHIDMLNFSLRLNELVLYYLCESKIWLNANRKHDYDEIPEVFN